MEPDTGGGRSRIRSRSIEELMGDNSRRRIGTSPMDVRPNDSSNQPLPPALADCLDTDPEVPNEGATRASFKGKRLHVTYACKVPKEGMYTSINNLYPLIRYSACNEKYQDGTWHSHVLLEFKVQPNLRNFRIFDYTDGETIVHPHWRRVSSNLHFERTVRYHKKEDPEPYQLNCDIKANDIEKRNKIQTSKSMRAITYDDELCELLFKKPAAVKLFWENRKPPEIELEDYELYLWQKEVKRVMEQPVNKRTVFWVVDKQGNTGKTFMADYMEKHFNAQVLQNGKKDDMAYTLEIDNTHVVLDIPMGVPAEQIQYVIMEGIKNGRVGSGKYESCVKRFKSPHLIIFSNQHPDYTKMAHDRWLIMDLDEHDIVFRTFEQVQRRNAEAVCQQN